MLGILSGISLTEWFALAVVLVTAAIALTALRATRAAQRSADISSRTAEAQLVAQFLGEYASPEMHAALVDLRQLLDQCQGDYSRVPATHPIHPQRRRIHHYFRKAFHLYEGDLLSFKSLQIVVGVYGYDLLFDVAEPVAVAAKLPGTATGRVDWVQRLEQLIPRG